MLTLRLLFKTIVSVASLGFCVSAYAETQVFQAVKDNTLFEDSHDFSSGGSSFVFTAQIASGSPRRALWQFDLSSIPPGSQVASASLRFVINRAAFASATTDQLRLHTLSASWGEGTSDGGTGGGGAQATANDATWAYRFYGDPSTGLARIPWLSLGGDFNPNPSASLNAGPTGTYTFASSPGLKSDVTAWINNPATNFGWILIGPEGPNDSQKAKRIISRESPSIADRPTLTVEFTPPAAATSVPLLTHLGSLLFASLLSFLGLYLSRRLLQR
jgi:hypothetical protein